MDIVFVRHGITEMNDSGRFIGHTDCDISNEGLKQAIEAKKLLEGKSFDGIYASSLKRSIQTAVELGGSYKLDERIREMNFGIFDGLCYKEIEERYPEHLLEWNSNYKNYKIPGGESLEEVFDRVEGFIDDMSRAHESVLAITHGGVIRCALSLAASSRELFYKFRVSHGSISVISIDNGYSYIKAVNCRSKIL